MVKVTAIFDNGGGIIVQTEDYVHHYDNPKQAARDAFKILQGESTDDWEGNEPDLRQVRDLEAERNGGVRWVSLTGTRALATAQELSNSPWKNAQEFGQELARSLKRVNQLHKNLLAMFPGAR